MNNNDIGDSSPLDTSDFQLQNSSVDYGFDITQRKDSLASSLDLSEHINYIVKPQDPLWDIANRETGDPLNQTKFKESDGTNFTSDEACRLQIDSTVLPKDNLTGLPLSEVDSFKYISPPDLITNYPSSTPIEDDIPSTVKPNSTLQELKALIEEKDNRIASLENMVMMALERPSFYDRRTINMGDGNYNERIGGNYVQGDNREGKQSHLNLQGAQIAGGLVDAENVTAHQIGGNITNYNSKLTQAAAQIQQRLEQLEQSYPSNTTTEKMTIAIEAIKYIESDPAMAQLILSALKVGGIEALAQLLNHPAASFVIGALEDCITLTMD